MLRTICAECVDKLKIAYKLREDCEEADKRMREYFATEFVSIIKYFPFSVA